MKDLYSHRLIKQLNSLKLKLGTFGAILHETLGIVRILERTSGNGISKPTVLHPLHHHILVTFGKVYQLEPLYEDIEHALGRWAQDVVMFGAPERLSLALGEQDPAVLSGFLVCH